MATLEAPARPQTRLHEGPFVNEPLTDFSKEDNARKMRAAIEKVRQAESANSLQLQQLMVSAAQASLAHESDMARIQAADRADARAMGISNKDWVPKVLAMAVTAGFFGILLLMAFQPLPGTNKDLVNVIVGALGSIVTDTDAAVQAP